MQRTGLIIQKQNPKKMATNKSYIWRLHRDNKTHFAEDEVTLCGESITDGAYPMLKDHKISCKRCLKTIKAVLTLKTKKNEPN